MKKIYLLFSSAVLASLPIMAQEKPAATPDDPEVVFTQDFESDQEGLSAQEAWQQSRRRMQSKSLFVFIVCVFLSIRFSFVFAGVPSSLPPCPSESKFM